MFQSLLKFLHQMHFTSIQTQTTDGHTDDNLGNLWALRINILTYVYSYLANLIVEVEGILVRVV